MLMRNMEIPNYKGKYILTDTAREARKLGIGPILSPLENLLKELIHYFLGLTHGKGLDYMYELINPLSQMADIGEKKYLTC